MSQAIWDYYRELYMEHFEEAGFLYENRIANLCDDQLQWHEFQDDEARLEAQLEALVIGGQLAMDIVLEFCKEGEVSAFYVLACLYCRHNDIRGLFKFFSQLDPEKPETLNALNDGLIQDWPDEWFASLIDYPLHAHPILLPLFLPLYANRRKYLDHNFCQNAITDGLLDQAHCLKSIRRLNASHSIPNEYWNLSKDDSRETIREKALCLLQLTDSYREFGYLQKQLADTQIPHAEIIIAADEPLARYICQHHDEVSVSRVIAMGLSGLPEHISLLVHYLKDDALAPTAAMALQTITGAGLISEQFIEEEWQEDELFADELKAFREGKMPQHPDGGPYGVTESVLSTDLESWQRWIHEHSREFQSGIRYRLGYPISPRTLVYTLTHPLCTRLIRDLTYEELVIRYDATVPFNTEDWVSKQKSAIFQLNQWANSVEHNFQAGDWYLHRAQQIPSQIAEQA